MAESRHHYSELLQILNNYAVEYLIVGGYAVMHYSEPRFTKDLDVWVHNSAENALRVFQALAEFGAPLKHDGVTPATFTQRNVVYQIGVPPVRLDFLTTLTGIEFADAWPKRVPSVIFGIPVQVISIEDLMANKQAAGRDQDIQDLRNIQRKKT